MGVTKTFNKRPTFETLLGGKGIEIPESHSKWLELEKNSRLQAFVNANPEELQSQDLARRQALREARDLKAAALRTGQDLGEAHLQQPPPRSVFQFSQNITDAQTFEDSINSNRLGDLMEQRDVVLAKEVQNRRRRHTRREGAPMSISLTPKWCIPETS